MDDPSAHGKLRPLYLAHQKLLKATATLKKTQDELDAHAAAFAVSESKLLKMTKRAADVRVVTKLFCLFMCFCKES